MKEAFDCQLLIFSKLLCAVALKYFVLGSKAILIGDGRFVVETLDGFSSSQGRDQRRHYSVTEIRLKPLSATGNENAIRRLA